MAQVLGHRRLDLKPDHASAPARLRADFEQPHEVFGLFFDFKVAVAYDAKCTLPLQVVTGKEPARVKADCLFQSDEPRRAGFGEVRQADEAIGPRRQTDHRVQHLAVALARQFQRDRSAEIGNERKRVGRIDGKRRQQGKDLVEEMIFQPDASALVRPVPRRRGRCLPRAGCPSVHASALLIGGKLRTATLMRLDCSWGSAHPAKARDARRTWPAIPRRAP